MRCVAPRPQRNPLGGVAVYTGAAKDVAGAGGGVVVVVAGSASLISGPDPVPACSLAMATPTRSHGGQRAGTDGGKHPSGRWGDRVPALDGLGGAGRGSGVDLGQAYELAQTFLLEDVDTPARGAAAGGHRGHHERGDLGEVEDDSRPELSLSKA